MSPDRRHGAGRETSKRGAAKPPAPKRGRREQVSLEDRLKPTTPPRGSVPTVLPGSPETRQAQLASRRDRRRAREEQKRAERRRWLLTGGGVLGVLVLVVLLVVFLAGRGEDDQAAPAPERTERTLTVTLAAGDDPASSGALMVYDVDNGSAGSVLVHSRLFVEGSTPQGIPFGETVQLPAAGAPGTALADTLDVLVDDTWQLSEGQLAALVDAADGVLVDVDVDVLEGPEGSQQTVVVAAGDGQLLGGDDAVAFATYLGPDESEESRLARFGQVLDQVLQRLPQDEASLLSVLQETAAADRATLEPEALADFLVGYGDVGRGGDTTYQTLPVTTLETGGRVPSLIVDPEGLERLRQGLLADSLPPDAGGQEIKVLVQNGVGTPGLEQKAAQLLREEGYDFLNGGNASEFGVDRTVVLIPDSTPASQSLGDDVAATLGLPASAVRVSDQGSTLADVIVVLGGDFQP